MTTAELVKTQHEHFAGGGFPENIHGNAIPVGARIIACVRDYFDLVGGRITRTPLTPHDAIERIRDRSGQEYDPEIVKVLIQVLPEVIDQNLNIIEAPIAARMLQPGMRLSRDIKHSEGTVLLMRGHRMNEQVIETLINLELRSDSHLKIYIEKEAS